MEHARCRICEGGLEPVRGLTFPDLGVSRCARCGLAHLSRTSSAPDYEAQSLRAFREDPEGYLRGHHYGIVDVLERVVRPAGSSRALLDVGCAFGAVVREARRRGWVAHGIDADAERIAEGSRFAPGLSVATLESGGFEAASQDAVVMWHVLEHIPRPDVALTQVRTILRPGGVLFLEVPNLGSPIAWLIYRRRWLGFETPGHLFAFTTRTLVQLVEAAGFEVEEVTRPAIAGRFPGGWKGLARRLVFGALHRIGQGDAVRVIARKSG